MTDSNTIGSDRLLNEAAVAEILGISIRTVQAWRVQGVGPKFVTCGRARRYRRCDLLAYIEANIVDSTSAIGARVA